MLTHIEDTGYKFPTSNSKKRRLHAKYQCSCGAFIERQKRYVDCGDTKSCGCLRKKVASKLKASHGMNGTKLFHIYHGMKQRCNNNRNKRYHDYGGRGIKICSEWNNNPSVFFEWALSNGYKEGLTIDRIDNDGNYEPSNCRWATMKEQAMNKRNTKIKRI